MCVLGSDSIRVGADRPLIPTQVGHQGRQRSITRSACYYSAWTPYKQGGRGLGLRAKYPGESKKCLF